MNDLTEHLVHEAEGFDRRGGSPLDIEQVLERAGEIKRGRRLRATLVMAAAVLAIAVPAGLVALDRDGSREPSPAPSPVKVDRSPITLATLAAGARPAAGWMQGQVWHRPDDSQFQFSGGRAFAVAPLGGFTVVASSGDQGQRAYLVPPVGSTNHEVTSWPMEGGFGVSADGAMVAFVRPDGVPVVLESDTRAKGITNHELPKVPRGSGFDAVAITGTTCDSPSDSVCAVWVTTSGKSVESWVSTPEGTSLIHATSGSPDMVHPNLWRVVDVLEDGTKAVMTQVNDTGSCSEIRSPDVAALWATCDDRFLSFSPDGQHLLASSAYADGAGDNRLVVLDAARGRPLLDLRTTDGAFIGQMVWEDDSHVLATVSDGGRWAIVRIGLDGSREYAVAPVTGKDPYESPFVLPSR